MRLGAKAPESAMRFNPLTVISRGAIGASVLVSELPDTLSLDYRGRRTWQLSRKNLKLGYFLYSTRLDAYMRIWYRYKAIIQKSCVLIFNS